MNFRYVPDFSSAIDSPLLLLVLESNSCKGSWFSDDFNISKIDLNWFRFTVDFFCACAEDASLNTNTQSVNNGYIDVGDGCWRPNVSICWWLYDGGRFQMLVTDSGCSWPIKYIEKITNITKKVANIMILPPTSDISHHHKVINISMSPTSLFPLIIWFKYLVSNSNWLHIERNSMLICWLSGICVMSFHAIGIT